MIILGIDSGCDETGWALMDTEHMTVLAKGITPNDEMRKEIEYVASTFLIDAVSIEMVASYGMPIGWSTIETTYWIGRFYQICNDLGLPTFRYVVKEINKLVCNHGGAKDTHRRKAVIEMFPRNGGGKQPQIGVKTKQGNLYGVTSHMWSALACCVAHWKFVLANEENK